MNNLLSYCGLVDAKIRASDKDLPVTGYPGLGSILGIYQFTGHIMNANPAHCLNITCDQEHMN